MSLTKRWIETQETASATTKLEGVRARLRSVSRNIQITEGRVLDYESADEMQRTLNITLRELEELTVTVAVMERRANHV